ncbi:MAG TPA: AI-2E family transporter [Hyphomicrobiaceae bacterium]|nr:AI-2E family transporter [Hyphomicrobiaceae bacterium]
MSQRAPKHSDPPAEPVRIAIAAASDLLARSSQVGIVGLFLIAIVWCAHVAQPVVVPVLLAWVIATIAGPPIGFLQERGVPRVVSAILVTCSLVVVLLILLFLLSAPLTYWIGRATELGMLIKQKLQVMSEPLAFLDEIRKSVSAVAGAEPGAIKVEQPAANVFSTLFAILTPAVGQTILFVGAFLFQLIYWERIQKAAVLLLRDRSTRLAALRTLKEINGNMSTYFSTLTIVNVCLAAVTVLLTWLVGLPNPLLWGVLAGLMNYIPYLGPAIVVGTLSVVGLIALPTLGEAAVAPLIYVAIATLEGYFITPAIMGKRLELNPFGVFLAIAFCAWLWGPIGAFLAVPLLIAVTVASDHLFLDEAPDLPE